MAQDINWFPGHMRKALNDTSEKLKYVDIVFETCDARIPFSSRNPELTRIVGSKPRIIILNKADLADDTVTEKWISFFRERNIPAVAVDSTKRKSLDKLRRMSADMLSEMLSKAAAKGRVGRPIRVMTAGVPNTGKSTIINALAGRKAAVTGDRPGVTRDFKWIRTDDNLEMMDMPGVLWPKIATKRSSLCLAVTGAIKTEVTDTEEIAFETMKILIELYPQLLCERYKIAAPGEDDYIEDDYERFLKMAEKRGCIKSGGRVDEDRFSSVFIDDFRQGRIGKISLESPDRPEGK